MEVQDALPKRAIHTLGMQLISQTFAWMPECYERSFSSHCWWCTLIAANGVTRSGPISSCRRSPEWNIASRRSRFGHSRSSRDRSTGPARAGTICSPSLTWKCLMPSACGSHPPWCTVALPSNANASARLWTMHCAWLAGAPPDAPARELDTLGSHKADWTAVAILISCTATPVRSATVI